MAIPATKALCLRAKMAENIEVDDPPDRLFEQRHAALDRRSAIYRHHWQLRYPTTMRFFSMRIGQVQDWGFLAWLLILILITPQPPAAYFAASSVVLFFATRWFNRCPVCGTSVFDARGGKLGILGYFTPPMILRRNCSGCESDLWVLEAKKD